MDAMSRAVTALEGLSIGDAFGEQFFVNPDVVGSLISRRALPQPPWFWTDDTSMALSVVETLRIYGGINQDHLARSLAEHYLPDRGYGPSMHGLLHSIRLGLPWRVAAGQLFGGRGSWGNGAAMRVAPLGAYFADDLDAVIREAERSTVVTHAHPEAAAGAVAVAVAAALACQARAEPALLQPDVFLGRVLDHVPDGMVREKIRHARNLAPGSSVTLAVSALGNGTGISAQDTVPFVLWCAAQRLESYQEALWLTVSGLGDRDTTCAMVGGIVACYTGVEGVPELWREAREELPEWFGVA